MSLVRWVTSLNWVDRNGLLLTILIVFKFSFVALVSLLTIWMHDYYSLAIPGLRELLFLNLYPALWSSTTAYTRQCAKTTFMMSTSFGTSAPITIVVTLLLYALCSMIASWVYLTWRSWRWRRAVEKHGLTKKQAHELQPFIPILTSLAAISTSIEKRSVDFPSLERQRDEAYQSLSASSSTIQDIELYATYTNSLRCLSLEHLRPILNVLTYLSHLSSRPRLLSRFDQLSQTRTIQELQSIPPIIQSDLLTLLREKELNRSLDTSTSPSSLLAALAHQYTTHLILLTGIFLQPDLLSSFAISQLKPLIPLAPPVAKGIAEDEEARRRRRRWGWKRFTRAIEKARAVDWEERELGKLEGRFEEAVIDLALVRREGRERRREERRKGRT
ncbi:hypothetical protein BCR35DRAFT_349249 [Leucosporidium creatinivorum]|uniref:Uncharacterized protein n=1 Tax=Leucosporidium creatinivorum TaxID=106004 RepID=A0A1Y2G628_9BASI|nr:hypothetical protein BCR35DRAFT_349249 [Leucosporidium creatinivorum]